MVGVLSGCEDYKVDPAEDSYLLQEVTAEELRKKEVCAAENNDVS